MARRARRVPQRLERTGHHRAAFACLGGAAHDDALDAGGCPMTGRSPPIRTSPPEPWAAGAFRADAECDGDVIAGDHAGVAAQLVFAVGHQDGQGVAPGHAEGE